VEGDGPLFFPRVRVHWKGKEIAVRLFVGVLFCIGGHGLCGTGGMGVVQWLG